MACPAAVRDALSSLPWVKSAKVDFATKQAVITVDDERYNAVEFTAKLKQAEELMATLQKQGYDFQVNAAN